MAKSLAFQGGVKGTRSKGESSGENLYHVAIPFSRAIPHGTNRKEARRRGELINKRRREKV